MQMSADIEECEWLKPCSHFCVNTIGSFRCQCPMGMALSGDGRDCTGAYDSGVGMFNCPHIEMKLRQNSFKKQFWNCFGSAKTKRSGRHAVCTRRKTEILF